MFCLTAFREINPRMLVTVPDSIYRWWEVGVRKVSDSYIYHVWRELTAPVDGAAAGRTEIGIEPFSSVGNATPRCAPTTGLLNGGFRPIT